MNIRITKIGTFYYQQSGTWSFSWKCRWRWIPNLFRMYPGFCLHWGWFSFEHLVFEENDWGEKKAETFSMIFQHILKEKA